MTDPTQIAAEAMSPTPEEWPHLAGTLMMQAQAGLDALRDAGYRLVREEDINRARGHVEQIRAFAAECEGMAWATIAVSAAEIETLLGGAMAEDKLALEPWVSCPATTEETGGSGCPICGYPAHMHPSKEEVEQAHAEGLRMINDG